MITEVYDIETFPNLFTYTGYCLQSKEYKQFIIHYSKNQINDLYSWLTQKDFIQVGYNNKGFDYPIIHYLLINYKKLSKMQPSDVAEVLYNKAQEIISSEQPMGIRPKDEIIPQVDLFAMWHYNNDARRTSLKDLEFAMKMPNVEDMPFHHTHFCREGDIPKILDYNKNDVLATYKHLLTTLGETDYSLYKGRDKIELRDSINEKFNFNCLNLADVTIGEQLMLELYSNATNKNKWDVKKLRSPRDVIHLKDCVPFWCDIKSKEFGGFLNRINNETLIGEKEYSDAVIFHGIRFDFGLGGTHGCIKPGIYKSEGNRIIVDLDVSSLYPSIAKSLRLYPEHLGEEFIDLYSGFINARLSEKAKPKKERNNALIEGYKLILNGTYGKSGEPTSFLYDPLYMYKTTIAGQLFVSMWSERLVEAVESLTFIQINTDGITISINKEDLEKIREVNNQLTKETTLEIEETFYSKMVIKDVNNYLAIYDDSTEEAEHIKYKGLTFLVDPEYHQDPSMRIVKLALKNYFVYNVPVEETIRNHDDIFDFCLRLKINSASKGRLTYYDDTTKNFLEIPLQRTTRYYISTTGGGLSVNYNGSSKVNRINVGYNCTLFNKYYESDNYNIDYNFYICKAKEIIEGIEKKQLEIIWE